MNKGACFVFFRPFALILSLAGTLAAQSTAPPDKTLVVNGKIVTAAVRQIDGHSYVDIEALAEITNAVVTIDANRIVLTIPVTEPKPAPAATPIAIPAQTQLGLSKEFARTAIAEVAEMREWRGAVGTMVNYGLAVSGTWAQDYHDRVDEGLRQATLAVLTEEDRSALQLLRNEFDALSGWANDIITARQNLNAAKTIDPNALQNDPALAKITACSRFLNAMLVSGTFSDDGTCH
jgi:hypothetical protein